MQNKGYKFIKYFINIFSFFLTIIVCLQTFKTLDFKDVIDNFYRPEFYVNYSAGFTRRGLDGHFIFVLSELLNFPPWTLQKLYSGCLFILFLLLTIFTIIQRKIPFYSVFSMSCLLLFLYYSANGFRKDHIILFLFLLNCYYILSINNKKLHIQNYIFQNVILVICILIHEVSFIFSFFPLSLLYLNKTNYKITKDTYKNMVSLFGVPFLLFILNSTLFKGNEVDGNIIINSWKKFQLNNLQFYSGIFNSPHYIWLFYHSFCQYFLFFCIFIIHFIFNITAHFENLTRKNSYLVFILLLATQYCLAILLSIIASDFSRWLFFANFTSIFTLYLLKSGLMEKNFKRSNFSSSKWLFSISCILYFFVTAPFSTEEKIEQYFNFTPIEIIFNYYR